MCVWVRFNVIVSVSVSVVRARVRVRVSSYHQSPLPPPPPHPPLAPSYLGPKVGVGFATEQELCAVGMPLSARVVKRRVTDLDARGLRRP